MNTQTSQKIRNLSAAVVLAGVVLTGTAFCGCSSQKSSSAASDTPSAASQATEAVTKKATESATVAVASKQDDVKVSMDDAVSIALIDAGFSLAEVQFTKKELDTDDGVQKYEINFINGEYEYEYDINAQTGAITEKSKDPMDD